MKIISRFVGIDKYSDPSIRDLTCAAKDARALWALFKDTLPDSDCSLLVNAQATLQDVRAALDASLSAATTEDVVIFSFSGHGSPDHHLTCHDTERLRTFDTALSMRELAKRFQMSDAKAIVCLLDCCFSGGAPARVLEDVPVARNDEAPFTEVSGKGRILISASAPDEPAYELSHVGHGIFTKAVIDAFSGPGESISLTDAVGQIMATVRAEAARIGRKQTPHMVGYIEGGLSFPKLVRGATFFTEFPERVGAKVRRP